jgi:hypothetical protein
MSCSNSASLLNRSSNRDSKPAPLKTIPPPTYGVDMDRLIGKPHPFGRVRHLREGLLIEPIGLLTL